MLPERIDLLEKSLTWPTSYPLEAKWQRRNAAVVAVSKYCPHLDGGLLRGYKQAAPDGNLDGAQTPIESQISKNSSTSSIASQEGLWPSAANYIRKVKKPRRYFWCYGDTQFPVVEHKSIVSTNKYCDTFATPT